jgi:hypothetical protein
VTFFKYLTLQILLIQELQHLNLTYSGSVGKRTIRFGLAGGATELNCPNINITAGTDIIDLL